MNVYLFVENKFITEPFQNGDRNFIFVPTILRLSNFSRLTKH